MEEQHDSKEIMKVCYTKSKPSGPRWGRRSSKYEDLSTPKHAELRWNSHLGNHGTKTTLVWNSLRCTPVRNTHRGNDKCPDTVHLPLSVKSYADPLMGYQDVKISAGHIGTP